MTEQEISHGADIAQEALMWVLFVRKPDITAGNLRTMIVQIFGQEVDAELAQRVAPSWDGTDHAR